MTRAAPLLLTATLLLGGCGLFQGPDVVAGCQDPGDADCDGVLDADDCRPEDPDVSPDTLEACNGYDDNCDGVVDEGFDSDADGMTTCTGDCDDAAATTYAGAPELCDGVDNDCNGVIDDGPDRDDDGDGVCSPADCDDASSTTFPGAPESCNGVDDDCDVAIDEDFDGDGDGWFDGADPGCAATYAALDCDDADPTRNPGADEICDGEDTDCDGVVDAPLQDVDADGDGVTACAGEDCDDGDPRVFPGAFETANGADDDCDGVPDGGWSGSGSVALLDTTYDGTLTLANIGTQVSGAGDINGDGLSDFIAAGPLYASGKGRAFVWLGAAFDLASPVANPPAHSTLTGPVAGEQLGSGVALADLDGDGYDDLILGSPEAQSATTPNGFVRIFWGAAGLVAGIWDPDDADLLIVGGHGIERCGQSVVNAGDMNGDGTDDLAIGCPWYTDTTGIVGRTAIFLGRERAAWTAGLTSDDADATILGEGTDSNTGTWIAGVGDLDGDGKTDLAIGSADWGGSQGRVGIKRGGSAAAFVVGQDFGGLDRLYDGAVFDALGTWIGGGDLDGDGLSDLFVGANGFDGGRGRILILRGADPLPASGDLPTIADVVFEAEGALDAGGTWAAVADLDNDGQQDLLASSPSWTGPLGGGQGRVSLFLGPVPLGGTLVPAAADATLTGAAGGDSLGLTLITVPDSNGDGVQDAILAAPASDAAAGAGGRLYLQAGMP